MTATAVKRDASHVRFREAGYWLDKTVDQLLTEVVAKAPDKVAIVADRADREQSRRLTYKELEGLANRAAASLLRLGVGRGDIVTVQLPNWWEFVVTAFACSKIGAVINPVMPILRERELTYILKFCQAKVFIVPKTYRGFDYAAMAQGMRGDLPDLKHVIVVDGEGDDNFERALLASEPGKLPSGLGPDDMAVLMFTSGTTGEPKGAVHTSNSLIACSKALSGRFGLDSSDVLLVASPVGHMTGYAAIVLLSVYLGGTMVLQDVWEAKRGVGLIASEGVTYTAVATPFLADICEVVKAGAPRPQSLRSFLCGGAPIPSVLVERAASELGLNVCSLWGMTEFWQEHLPSRRVRRTSLRALTDGRWRVWKSGLSILRTAGPRRSNGAATGAWLPDVQGLLQEARTADLRRRRMVRFRRSGLHGRRGLHSYCRPGEGHPDQGRGKRARRRDREPALQHPAVAAVAVVGFPDARLGERGCAFIVPRAGNEIDLAAVQTYLRCEDGEQFWPERVEVVTELPRTASGTL